MMPPDQGSFDTAKLSCQLIRFPTAGTPQAASIVILHDELHKSILLLFRQADTYLAQFNQHILDHIRCAQMTNISPLADETA